MVVVVEKLVLQFEVAPLPCSPAEDKNSQVR